MYNNSYYHSYVVVEGSDNASGEGSAPKEDFDDVVDNLVDVLYVKRNCNYITLGTF